jgi:GNAT superfamily N-acetyltransferase
VTLAAAETAAPQAIFAALEASWPPLRWHAAPGWRVGEGGGGGKRVSAGLATDEDASPAALAAAQRALGQKPLAMIRQGEERLDARLAGDGWRTLDPTVAFAAPAADLSAEPPRLTAFEVEWPPLAVQAEIWNAGAIDAARRAVMARVQIPKCALMGRADDTPMATAFVACHDAVAMVHALEVTAGMRRRGVGGYLMRAAALWARRQGAETLAVLVTRANAPACALYRALGMAETAAYHYRLREDIDDAP